MQPANVPPKECPHCAAAVLPDLLNDAATLDELARVTAQRDALAEALRYVRNLIDQDWNHGKLSDWEVCCVGKIDAALVALEPR